MHNRLTTLIVTLLSAALLTGCDEAPITNTGSGTLSLGIVDAPVDGASKIEITLNSIELKPYAAEVITYTFATPLTLDLLSYQGSNARIVIPSQTVVGGKYSWVRLNIDDSKSYVYIGSTRYNLTFPDAAAQNRLRINDSFTLAENGSIDLTIDFDLRRSVLEPLNVNGNYRLVPTLRLVDNSQTATITGTIPNTVVNANGCGGYPAVYLFEGSNVTPDDLDNIDADPFASALPTGNASNNNFSYTLGFIPAGNYTIAFTCHANLDKPESSDTGVIFGPASNVTVKANTPTTYNFPAP